jgi:hypothetical protein
MIEIVQTIWQASLPWFIQDVFFVYDERLLFVGVFVGVKHNHVLHISRHEHVFLGIRIRSRTNTLVVPHRLVAVAVHNTIARRAVCQSGGFGGHPQKKEEDFLPLHSTDKKLFVHGKHA